MKELTLIYFEDCPNANGARKIIREAGFSFKEVRQNDLDPGDEYLKYSSPTILLDDEVLFGAKSNAPGGGCSLHLPSSDELRKIYDKFTAKGAKG